MTITVRLHWPRIRQRRSGLLDSGRQIVGGSEQSAVPLTKCDFKRPTAVVIGNEEEGITAELLMEYSSIDRIPLSGELGSLNAAVASAPFCYGVQLQRNSPGGRS